ncbi:MAG TPA: chemotaxis protein CheA, partial [Candidatus Wallbacteria bacterium]|nr:chemotaxis protein CheA [Candidatus Wallbacteria bacterium]
KIKEGKIAINGYYSDLLLNSVDMIKNMIENARNGLLSAPDEYEEILNLLINSCSDRPVQPVNTSQDEPELETIKITDNENRHITPSLKSGQETDSTIRVKTDKVDRLIDAVGELVILNSMIFQDPVLKTSKNYELYKKITQAVKMVRELQDISMSMRMIQFKGLFQKMTRLVRDTAKKSNKNIEFLTYGSESEVDRNLVDIIDGALIHLLRNSIDHGIESPQERLQAGKPEKGTVKLSAFHEGGNVVIEVTDDGAGLNSEKIISKALAKGIIKTSSGLSESEVYNLIFTPGFSTADAVTDISGRGVGMDVVKTSIEKLKGRIEISSQKGRGSKFTLRMPLTLALTDGMLVRVGEHKFIIPVLNVQLTFQAEASKISKFEARQEMVTHQGRTLPIFKLGEIFNITDAVSDISKGMVIVVNDGKAMSGFLVDEIIGQQQIVAKSLDGEIKNVAGISGGTILSNGRVGLIIDVLEALKLARKK